MKRKLPKPEPAKSRALGITTGWMVEADYTIEQVMGRGKRVAVLKPLLSAEGRLTYIRQPVVQSFPAQWLNYSVATKRLSSDSQKSMECLGLMKFFLRTLSLMPRLETRWRGSGHMLKHCASV